VSEIRRGCLYERASRTAIFVKSWLERYTRRVGNCTFYEVRDWEIQVRAPLEPLPKVWTAVCEKVPEIWLCEKPAF